MTATLVDLTAVLGRLVLPSAVLTAAGTGGALLAPYLDLAALGAVVSPTVLTRTWTGSPGPRTAPTPSGLLHATDLPGPGVTGFVAEVLPTLGPRVVVSVGGGHSEEFADVARVLAGAPGVVALEANLAGIGPGRSFATDTITAARVVGALRRATDPAVPVFAKLTADVPDVGLIARACADAGADGFTVTGEIGGLAIDTTTLRPVLAAELGSLAGPATRPVALRGVWQVRRAVPYLPIIGGGGITSGLDALQFVLAGASAVQVGTASFTDPRAASRVQDELVAALAARGFSRLSEAVGLAHRRTEESR